MSLRKSSFYLKFTTCYINIFHVVHNHNNLFSQFSSKRIAKGQLSPPTILPKDEIGSHCLPCDKGEKESQSQTNIQLRPPAMIMKKNNGERRSLYFTPLYRENLDLGSPLTIATRGVHQSRLDRLSPIKNRIKKWFSLVRSQTEPTNLFFSISILVKN